MTSLRIPGLLALAVACLLTFGPAQAADSDGQYAVKGPGQVPCERYSQAYQQKSDAFHHLLTWMTGYLTAYNRFEPNTFDVAPWQTMTLMAPFLDNYCQKHPQYPFAKAAESMAKALMPHRLADLSPKIMVRINDRDTPIYQEVLVRAQKALKALGYYDAEPDGTMNSDFRGALEKFQLEKKLRVTGVPDQVTLLSILQP